VSLESKNAFHRGILRDCSKGPQCSVSLCTSALHGQSCVTFSFFEVICSWAPVQLVAGGCVAAANYKCEAAGAAFTARFEADETSTNEENEENETETSPCEEEYGKKDSKD